MEEEKIKIAHIIPALNGGGGERFVVDLCNELSKNPTLSIYLITLFNITDDMFLVKHISPKVKVYSLGKKIGFDYKVIYKLFLLLGRIKPNIVNTHLRSFEYNTLNFLFRKNIKYFHTLHSDAIVECTNSKLRQLRKWFYKRKKVTPITISYVSAQSFKDAYSISNDRLIFNGRNPLKKSKSFDDVQNEFIKNFQKTHNTKVFLNVGNILPVKNQLALIKAFNKHIKEGADVCLLIIGDSRPEHKELKEKLISLCGEGVHYLGMKENVADYFFLADAFCLSSKMEGMPITIIESFSAECFPICTPVGGVPDMITDLENGILAKGHDLKSIYEMITRFMKLEEKRKNQIIKKNQILFSEKFAIKTCAENYLNTYTR